MHRKRLLMQLGHYTPIEDADRACRDRFVAFVQAHPGCFERSLLVGHVTGSAWVVDPSGQNTLLTHHRKLGKWVQLGGHCDGDPDTLAVAAREACEESGIDSIEPKSDRIFDLDIHEIPARRGEPNHLHYDVRFAFQVTGDANFRVSEESIDLAWVPIEALSDYSTQTSMLRMKDKWRCWFAKKGGDGF